MPEIICDTSPIQYLYQIGHLNLLPDLAGKIILPPAVVKEPEVGLKHGVKNPRPKDVALIYPFIFKQLKYYDFFIRK